MKQDKIKTYAKELYTTYNEDGSKTYSLRDISTAIQQKFNKKINYSTVGNWAKKELWDKLNEKIKQQSIIKAKDERFTTEEKLIESKSNDLAETYKHADQLEKVGFKVAFDIYEGKEIKGNINFKDALQAVKLASDIKFRINEIPENINLSLKEQLAKIKKISFVDNTVSEDEI